MGPLMLEFVLSSSCLPKTRNKQGKIIEANTILCSFVETGRSWKAYPTILQPNKLAIGGNRRQVKGFQQTKRFAKKCDKFQSHFANFFAKCENFVKTIIFIAATISCLKELVEFSALIAQYLKFFYDGLLILQYLQVMCGGIGEVYLLRCIRYIGVNYKKYEKWKRL